MKKKKGSLSTFVSLTLMLLGLVSFVFAEGVTLQVLSTVYGIPSVVIVPITSTTCYEGDILKFYARIRYKYLVVSAVYSLYVDGVKVKTFNGYLDGYCTFKWEASGTGSRNLYVVCEQFRYSETYVLENIKTYTTPFQSNVITVTVNPIPPTPKPLTVEMRFDDHFWKNTLPGYLSVDGARGGDPLKWEVLLITSLGERVMDSGHYYYGRERPRFSVKFYDVGTYRLKAHVWGSGYEGYSKIYTVDVKKIPPAPVPIEEAVEITVDGQVIIQFKPPEEKEPEQPAEGAIIIKSPVETQVAAKNVETGEVIQASTNDTIYVKEGTYIITSAGTIPLEPETVEVPAGEEVIVEMEISQELAEANQTRKLGIVMTSLGVLSLVISRKRK